MLLEVLLEQSASNDPIVNMPAAVHPEVAKVLTVLLDEYNEYDTIADYTGDAVTRDAIELVAECVQGRLENAVQGRATADDIRAAGRFWGVTLPEWFVDGAAKYLAGRYADDAF